MWKQRVEDIWNAGLNQYMYRGCYTFQVEVRILDLPVGAPFPAGYHRIAHVDKPTWRSCIFPPVGVGKNDDSAGVYRESLHGFWRGSIGPGILAHEVTGLGDDYVDKKDESGKVIARGGTMMADQTPRRIDQTIVDRLGNLIDQAGMEWPGCWQGRWRVERREYLVATDDAPGLSKGDRQPFRRTTLRGSFTFSSRQYGSEVSGSGWARIEHNPVATLSRPYHEEPRLTMSPRIYRRVECDFAWAPAALEGPVGAYGLLEGDHLDLWVGVAESLSIHESRSCRSWNPKRGWGSRGDFSATWRFGHLEYRGTLAGRDAAEDVTTESETSGWAVFGGIEGGGFELSAEQRTRVEIRGVDAPR